MTAPTYSIILPTYNERENLPLIIWLIDHHLSEQLLAPLPPLSPLPLIINTVAINMKSSSWKITLLTTPLRLQKIFRLSDQDADLLSNFLPVTLCVLSLPLLSPPYQEIYGSQKIQILSRSGKLGLGSAYMDGLKKCRGEFIFLMDADMSHHPRHMREMIQRQREKDCDVVTGTRYASGGGVSCCRSHTHSLPRIVLFFFSSFALCLPSSLLLFRSLDGISSESSSLEERIFSPISSSTLA
jgi:glycosyltransferase involved in cell wall biosynthesis